MFLRVSEDYSPFDVDVTTEDPGPAGILRSSDTDEEYGVQAIIGGNGSWYPASVGGIAFTYSFGSYGNSPVFIFEDTAIEPYSFSPGRAVARGPPSATFES